MVKISGLALEENKQHINKVHKTDSDAYVLSWQTSVFLLYMLLLLVWWHHTRLS